MIYVLLFVAGLLLCVAAVFVARTTATRSRIRNMEQACATFMRRREWLEADFLTNARRSGKPRGLEWSNIDFDKEVSFARERHAGHLQALVGVTISFEAVAGGGMEDVEAVSNLRSATAVFRFVNNKWETDGRTVFNLNPLETIRHFKHDLEPVRAGQATVRR